MSSPLQSKSQQNQERPALPRDSEACSRCPQGLFCLGVQESEDNFVAFFKCKRCDKCFRVVDIHWDPDKRVVPPPEEYIDENCPRIDGQSLCAGCLGGEQWQGAVEELRLRFARVQRRRIVIDQAKRKRSKASDE